MGRTASEAYNAQQNYRDMTGEPWAATNPTVSLPDPDAPDASMLYRLMALRVREMYVSPMHAERARGEALAQRLAAVEGEGWEWLEDVGHPVDPEDPDVDPEWDDETDYRLGRW